MALTPEQKAEARAMWDAGKSYGAIGKHFRVGKNVICGVGRTDGWPKKNLPDPAPAAPRRARALPAGAASLPPLASLA